MAEDLQVCNPEPFVGTQQFEVPIATTIVKITEAKGVAITMPVCRRPILPLWGVGLNATTGAYEFKPSTKGNEIFFIELAKACYQASVNFAAGTGLASNFQYTPNNGQNFGGYLNRKLSADTCLFNRYLEAYNKVYQFFNLHAAIGAFNFAIYTELTDILIPKVMREVDKQMYIPPGNYFFSGGGANPVVAAFDAWTTADPTIVALFALELVTT
jgi:hypothetical protein